MKRFLSISMGLTLIVALAIVFGAPRVEAATICPNGEPVASDGSCPSETVKRCYDKWNGESPPKDSDRGRAYLDSGCDKPDGGTCTAKTVTRDGTKHLDITCKKPFIGLSGSPSEGYTDEAVGSSACTKNSCDIIDKFVNPFIKLLSVLVGVAAVIGIIIGAIQVSTSAGDPQKAANGKNHIRNAIIAIVAYVLLFVILNWLIPGGIL